MAGVSESRTWDAVLTTTLANYRKKFVDNIFDVYPTLSWFCGRLGDALRGGMGPSTAGGTFAEGPRSDTKRLRVEDGGESIVEHLMYEASSAVQSYSKYQALDVTPQDGATIARFNWRQYATSISISGFEKRVNSGEAKMIDLLKFKTAQAEMSLRKRLGTDIWGSNSDGVSLDGLGIILSSSASCGGLSPSTYAWWAPTITASGSFAAQGLKDMRTTYNTISFGDDRPDAIFMPQAVFQYFESSLQSQERYNNTNKANTGFETLTFKGNVPVIFDRLAPSGTASYLNSQYVNWVVHKDANFATGKFVQPENQDAMTALIILQANVTTNNRRAHGQMQSITA